MSNYHCTEEGRIQAGKAHPGEMSLIPLGRDVLSSADRGAFPQRYNRKYFASCDNNQIFIPAAASLQQDWEAQKYQELV